MSKILSDEDGDTIWNEHFTEDELRHPHESLTQLTNQHKGEQDDE